VEERGRGDEGDEIGDVETLERSNIARFRDEVNLRADTLKGADGPFAADLDRDSDHQQGVGVICARLDMLMYGDIRQRGQLTNSGMHHVDLSLELMAVYRVLARSMEVELLHLKFPSADDAPARQFHLHIRPRIEQLRVLPSNIHHNKTGLLDRNCAVNVDGGLVEAGSTEDILRSETVPIDGPSNRAIVEILQLLLPAVQVCAVSAGCKAEPGVQ
jgi:hypothetical protein